MGRTLTPKYRIELTYVDYLNKRISVQSFAYSVKEHGKPNTDNAKKFRDGMNESLNLGGTNEHLRIGQSDYSKATIIEQSTSNVVAEFNPPMFEVRGNIEAL